MKFARLAFLLVNLVNFGKSQGLKQPFTLSHYINKTFQVNSFNPTFVGTEFELFDSSNNNNSVEQVETKPNQNLYFETDETSGDIFVKDILFFTRNNVSAYSVKFAEIGSKSNNQEKGFVNFVSNDAKYSGFKETLMS